MIDFLKGRLAYVESDYVVLNVQGVGYRVFCPNPFVFQGKFDEELMLYVHHHVREEAIALYGFAAREEQTLFRLLLDVSGIGPRVAIGILSGGRPNEVIAAIRREDVMFLTRLHGIGKKTAQRMILDLKDKLSAVAATGEAEAASSAAAAKGAADPNAELAAGTAWTEAREALAALGYTEAELDRVARQLGERIHETGSLDAVMKLALQTLYKG